MSNGESSYRRFLAGEKDAIVEIVSEYSHGLILFLNSITKSTYMSEEIAEDTFCKLLIEKPEYKGKSSFKTWLYTIARNLALRSLKHRNRFVDSSVDEMQELSDEEDIEKDYLKSEQKRQLHKALGKINAEYSQVLYLTYFEGFSNSEAATIMKKSNKQIENLIYRAKAALKKDLEREGFVYEKL
ncbi:MAG: RNA polymerase sigma factor [Ruminococcus sp.]|nr:RNA polymerase sigma factor [Ruminococcus sp.]